MKKLLLVSLVFPLVFILSGCNPEQPVVKFAILATSSSNGALNPSGNINVESGKDATIVITPKDGYVVGELKVDGKVVPSAPSFTFYKVNANHKLEVTFKERDKEKFLVEASASIGGTISPSSVEVIKGQNATFNVTTNEGYSIDSLIVDGKAVLVTTSTFTLVNITASVIIDGKSVEVTNYTYTLSDITADHKIRVVFKDVADYVITSAGPNGTISPSVRLTYHQNVSIEIVPDTGYIVESLTVDGKKKDSFSFVKSTYTFNDGYTYNHTISVTFIKKPDVYFYATEKPWYGDSIQERENTDDNWGPKVADTFNEVIYLLSNGQSKIYWDGKFVGNTPWPINYKTNPPSLNDFGSYSIEEIDNKHMVILNSGKTSRRFYYHH